MALRYEYATQAEIPEANRALYVAKDGKFILDVEGVVPQALHDELRSNLSGFRDNNVKLMKALGAADVNDALAKLETLKSVDPAEYAKLKKQLEKLKKTTKDDSDEPDVESYVSKRFEELSAPLVAELSKVKKDKEEAQAKADRALLRQVVGDKYLKAGGRADALDFILSSAPFTVQGDKVVAREGEFSRVNISKPIEVDEWLVQTTKEKPFAFEPNKGGGSGGNGNGNPPPAIKPGVLQLVNPTPQELGRHSAAIAKGEAVIVKG